MEKSESEMGDLKEEITNPNGEMINIELEMKDTTFEMSSEMKK